jgi:hypothetical protein
LEPAALAASDIQIRTVWVLIFIAILVKITIFNPLSLASFPLIAKYFPQFSR